MLQGLRHPDERSIGHATARQRLRPLACLRRAPTSLDLAITHGLIGHSTLAMNKVKSISEHKARPAARDQHLDDSHVGWFRNELDLVEELVNTFGDRSNKQWLWFREVESPNGVADLTAVRQAPVSPGSSRLSQIPSRWVYSLHALEMGTPFTATDFSRRHGCSLSTATDMLSIFTESGYLERRRSCAMWEKVTSPTPFAEEIVAIEAKLRDWRRALYQATRYCDFATESWVVLDELQCRAVESNVEHFIDRGIGLGLLTRGGHLKVLCRPIHRPARSPHRQWEVNAVLARRHFSSKSHP